MAFNILWKWRVKHLKCILQILFGLRVAMFTEISSSIWVNWNLSFCLNTVVFSAKIYFTAMTRLILEFSSVSLCCITGTNIGLRYLFFYMFNGYWHRNLFKCIMACYMVFTNFCLLYFGGTVEEFLHIFYTVTFLFLVTSTQWNRVPASAFTPHPMSDYLSSTSKCFAAQSLHKMMGNNMYS